MESVVAVGYAPSRPSARSGARPVLRLALASVLCGLGLAAATVTLVRAGDDAGVFELIQNDRLARMAASWRLPSTGYGVPERRAAPSQARTRAAARLAERKAVARKARLALAAKSKTTAAAGGSASDRANRIAGQQTLCVRTCDGYAFPLGHLAASGDVPAHETACRAACPGAATQLYTSWPGSRLGETALARAASDGTAYGQLSTAFLFRSKLVPSCSCQGTGAVAQRVPFLLDPTLRSGDVVMGPEGDARVFSGPLRVPHSGRDFADYRGNAVLGRQARAEIDRAVGTSQREAVLRAWERKQRAREALVGANDTRHATLRGSGMREISAPAGSAAGVRVYQAGAQAGTTDPSGARIILIR